MSKRLLTLFWSYTPDFGQTSLFRHNYQHTKMSATITAQQYARVSGAYNDVLDLDIGPLKKRLQVHKGLATSESDFLQSAVHSHWTRAAGEGIDLSDYDVPAVGMFFAWLYDRVISLPSRTSDQSSDTLLVESLLIKAYILGQQLMAPGFCNDVIDALNHFLKSTSILPPADAVNEAFEGTCDKDALRRLIVNTFVDFARRKAYPKLEVKGLLYHVEFYHDLTQQLVSELSDPTTQDKTADHDKETSTTCEYHQHSTEEPVPCQSFSCDQLDYVTRDKFYNGVPRSSMIKILVGPECLPFYTYETDLVYAKSYPELKPKTFEDYMHWQVLGWTPSMILPHLCKPWDEESVKSRFTTLFDIFHLACVLDLRMLRNDVIEAVVACMCITQQQPPIDVIDYAFSLTTRSNMLTELCAFSHVCKPTLPVSGNLDFYRTLAIIQKAIQRHAILFGEDRVYIDSVRCKLFHEHLKDYEMYYCTEEIEQKMYQGRAILHSNSPLLSSASSTLRTQLIEGMAKLERQSAT